MPRFLTIAAMSVAFASLAMLFGCGATSEPTQSADPVASDATAKEEPESEIDSELAKLSEADRKLAEAQKVCPVTGEPLGSMGAPIKVTVDGRSLFVCCEGCEVDAKKNFDEYFAKLQSQPATADAK